MKKYMITALLITTMISMTACGNKNTDATTETVSTTVAATEETITTEVATQDQIATLPVTTEEKPVVDATPSPDPKATEAPKATATPETTAKPKSTEAPNATTKPSTQTAATATATEKPSVTTVPENTTAPKSTKTTTNTNTTTATATEAPTTTQAPAPTAQPVASTPAPTAAPVACQHKSTHVENAHDTYQVPISGGCYEDWETNTIVCNDCGANLGEAQRKVNEVHHGKEIAPGVSATCTTDGRSAVYGCDCGGAGETGGDVIPATGHDYHDEYVSSDVIKDENGNNIGVVHHYQSVCYNCGDVSRTWDETEN